MGNVGGFRRPAEGGRGAEVPLAGAQNQVVEVQNAGQRAIFREHGYTLQFLLLQQAQRVFGIVFGVTGREITGHHIPDGKIGRAEIPGCECQKEVTISHDTHLAIRRVDDRETGAMVIP